MLYSKIFKKLVILAVFAAQTVQVIGGAQSSVQPDFADIAQGGFFMRASRIVTSVVHEFGHAVMDKIIHGKNSSLRANLGSLDSKVWCKLGPLTVKRDALALFPTGGQFAHNTGRLVLDGFKPAAILAAGPASGLVMAGCIGYAAHQIESRENKNLSATLYGIAGVEAARQLHQFVPRVEPNKGLKSDGEFISVSLNFSENAKRTFTRSVRGAIAVPLALAGSRIWNLYSSAKAENQI